MRIKATPHGLAGPRGPEVPGLLQNGTLAIASQNGSCLAGDDPRSEAIDLAGISLTIADAGKATDACRATLTRLMEQKLNPRLPGIGPLPSQVFWWRVPITGVADLRGRKVRVFNATLSDFVAGAGGTTVTVPFVEVIPALRPCDRRQAMRASMTLVPVTQSDMATHARILREDALPAFARRCARACTETWNATVGRAPNLSAPPASCSASW